MKGIMQVAGNLLLAVAVVWGAGAMAGCHGQHPDRAGAVYQALNQQHLNSVEVYQNRDRGVITLKGIVGSANGKTQAAQVVQQAAPGYKVDNPLTVDATGIMSMANPNARPPDVEQMAHPQENVANSAPPAKTRRHP